MPDTEEIKIPRPPDTMRATPQAIAHELEPHMERIYIRVLSEMNQMFAGVLTRLEKQALMVENAIAGVKTDMRQQFNELRDSFAELKQQQLLADRRGARLVRKQADHERRLAALEATKKKRAKRNAHHAR